MSLKWRRSLRWDDEHIPAWAWPAKFVLRAFSSIWLAVVLLSGVALYAIFASVPVGLLALAPTFVAYALSLVVPLTLASAVSAWAASTGVRAAGGGRGARFLASFGALAGVALAIAWTWRRFAWPALRYDPADGSGFRLFAGFCERYASTTLRRLPGLEMSELEFYAWWPMRVLLLAFVANMVIATVRRIEFRFVNLGVLTVHTGIVIIALGAVYYKGAKREGVTVLWAGELGAEGVPEPGPPQSVFYDNTRVSLYVSRGSIGGWEQRPIRGLPRYNDYNLRAGVPAPGDGPRSFRDLMGGASGEEDPGLGALAIDVPALRRPSPGEGPPIRFRVVGYASYAEARPDMLRAEPGAGLPSNPLRVIEVASAAGDGEAVPAGEAGLVGVLFPRVPALRVAVEPTFELEYTIGLSDARWADLTTPLPESARHALVVRAGEGAREVATFDGPGSTARIGAGAVGGGLDLVLREAHEEPPFPIITRGYEDAPSSLAVVGVTRADGSTFDRWVYHRFPEISQDFVPPAPGSPDARPVRRPADPSIQMVYVDATRAQVFVDERPDGSVRVAIRRPGGEVVVREGLGADEAIEDAALGWTIRLGERWPHAEPVELPRVVPEGERRRDFIGTHDQAMLALEASGIGSDGRAWSRLMWLPFTNYPGSGYGRQHEREMLTPTGAGEGGGLESVRVMWGRTQHPFPDFVVQLVDFAIEQYDHRGSPRDFRSILRVTPSGMGRGFEAYEHATRLNAPLQAPFHASPSRSMAANVIGRLVSRLDPAQFKLSQSGWDAEGWRETQARADAGEIPRPFASYTVLGVGNNPGIHVVALGGILVIAGTPWAFYVKPLILRARTRAIQRRLGEDASGSSAAPVRERSTPVPEATP